MREYCCRLLTALLLLMPQAIQAANGIDVSIIDDVINELYDTEDSDEEQLEEIRSILTTMALRPRNINTVTEEELLEVPLLSDQQAAAIISHRNEFGNLRTRSELLIIEGISEKMGLLLQLLFYADADNLDEPDNKEHTDTLRQHNRNQRFEKRDFSRLILTAAVPLYEREGFRDSTYHGSPVSQSLRYMLHKGNYTAAFTAANDAGEEFFKGSNRKGWDFYTGFVQMKYKGIVRNAVAGHYQMNIGMGLVLNTIYRPSRSALLMSMPSVRTMIRGHQSRSESNYLQGAAATLAPWGRRRPIDITLWASWRQRDARLNINDSTDAVTITTLQKSGYHRTDSELLYRYQAEQTTAGISCAYNHRPIYMALSVQTTRFNYPLLPDPSREYQRYNPEGRQFTAGSVVYAYTKRKLSVSGETALTQSENASTGKGPSIAMATANSFRWQFARHWVATALQRFYSYRFHSPLGMSFGDMSNCQNESGIYAGISTTAIPRLTIAAYADYAYHPWLRYGYDWSSHSLDACLTATYSHDGTTVAANYRMRNQDSDVHTLRLRLRHNSGGMTYTSQLQAASAPSSFGWLAAQGVGYKYRSLRLYASIAYCNTSDYASRLYLSDQVLTYGMSIAMMYGKQMRGSLLAEVPLTRQLTAALRLASVHYFDRDVISSGHQQINSSNQNDVQIQIKWRM